MAPAGGSESLVGLDFAFHDAQRAVRRLGSWGVRAAPGRGTVDVCDFGNIVVDDPPSAPPPHE